MRTVCNSVLATNIHEDSMYKLFFILHLFVSLSIFPQQFSLKGKVTDSTNNEPLSFANVRIDGTTRGTAANAEGNFEFKLKPGNYKIISSFIGYKSDTIIVNLYENTAIKFLLSPIPVRLSEVTVLPKENPALEIIRRAIAAKHIRNSKINSYVFKAYTKGLAKTTRDLSTTSRSVSFSITKKDTGNHKITGIIENESRGYFKKPNYYKDEIIARKQSANTPSTINTLTGGRFLQNFYTDDIQFFNRQLISPIADNALDYYYYIIQDTLAMDNRNVFKISFEPIDVSDPGFYGNLFIADNIFSLVKIDVDLNNAANPGGIFNRVNIFQQYVPFDQNIYMPIDYRVFVDGNVLGMAKFGFELNSIFYDYQINQEIDDDFFDMTIVKVMPDADKKDSIFWKSTQTIPNTTDEMEAYKRIDSLEAIPRNFWDDFSILSSTLQLSDKYSITGPLGLYGFNKVEGHSLNFGGSVSDELDNRLYGELNFGYGFSDKKLKTDFSTRYYLGEYRTFSLTLNAYNKITDLFGSTIYYNNLTSTLTSLIGKYDFRDYYYTTGWDIKIAGDVLPILRLGFGIKNQTDKNANNNTDFSFFNKSKKYRENKTIYDTKINAFTASFVLDFRKFIEDGYRRFRFTPQDNAYAALTGEAIFSNNSILKSNLDYQFYNLELYGRIPSFKSSVITFRLNGFYSNGPVPFQMMYSLPGNIESASKRNSFRTLRTGESFGNRGIQLNLQQNFSDDIFHMLDIPLIKNLRLNLTAHFNAALMEISNSSKSILPHAYSEFKHPFYEMGFGIGHALFPVSIEFTWRLNYRGKNNFVITLNSIIL